VSRYGFSKSRFFQVAGAPYNTNICFGGLDMRDAWTTASRTGCLSHTRWPNADLRLNYNG